MKSKLIDLIIPGMLILGCLTLMICGIDGEVKTVLLMAAGWAFRAGTQKK